MTQRIDFIGEEKPRFGGVGAATAVSLLIHSLLVIYFIKTYRPIAKPQASTPMVRYVELMRQNSKPFTEAPGQAVKQAPIDAPFSDANRRASMPEATGTTRTTMPGEGGSVWSPPARPRADGRPEASPAAQAPQAPSAPQTAPAPEPASPQSTGGTLTYRPPAPNGGAVDWRQAIRDVGTSRAHPGGQGMEGAGAGGGEKGFAESGPLSFETQWYDWGEYAQSMVSRIRVNWYAIMPDLVRTGMKGVVTIRFTIHRDGHITDVTILNSSGVPPYDNAAAQAIRAASPLRPLPKDFPNETERVTCLFYYNMEIPRG